MKPTERLRKFKDFIVNEAHKADLIGDLKKRLKISFSLMMNLFVFLAIGNIFLLILSPTPDFANIINIGENVTLFLVAITGLVFTYAAALGTSRNKGIIKSGEYFLKSFLIFVVGMVFSIGLKKGLMPPYTGIIYLSKVFSLLEPIFIFALYLTFLFFFIALVILIVSGYFFVKGITVLWDSMASLGARRKPKYLRRQQ